MVTDGEALLAVDYLHRMEVLHRDLRLRQLLLTREGPLGESQVLVGGGSGVGWVRVGQASGEFGLCKGFGGDLGCTGVECIRGCQ